MAKTDNPELAKVACEGCGGEASVKRRANGKRLLYLHCPSCGVDQRSGAKLQAEWQAAIDGITPNQPTEQTESITETTELAEWHPEETNDSTTQRPTVERIENPEDGDSESSGGIIIGGIAILAACVGVAGAIRG